MPLKQLKPVEEQAHTATLGCFPASEDGGCSSAFPFPLDADGGDGRIKNLLKVDARTCAMKPAVRIRCMRGL